MERIYRTTYRTREEAELDLVRWIDGRYNLRRIQRELGWLSPDEYEEATTVVNHLAPWLHLPAPDKQPSEESGGTLDCILITPAAMAGPSSTGLLAQWSCWLSRGRPILASAKAPGVGRMSVDRAQFWAMVQTARTASRDHVSRQLELAAARRGDLPPLQLVGYRRMELLAARLGDLPMSEIVGDRWLQQPVEGRLGDLDLLLTEVISIRQVELLAARLGDLPLWEVVGFHRVAEELETDSFRVDLWGAALVIHRMGPVDDFWCSEDTLFGFREWLVEQGRLVYEAAIADPDSLADNPELDDSLPWGKGTWGGGHDRLRGAHWRGTARARGMVGPPDQRP